MINPWFKFYASEYLSDPKIAALTPQERSCWVTLLCLCCNASNEVNNTGVIKFLTIEVLLQKSGIIWDPYYPEEWDKCLAVLTKFERMKMIKTDEDGYITKVCLLGPCLYGQIKDPNKLKTELNKINPNNRLKNTSHLNYLVMGVL